jgi:hypothetical protein
MDVIYTANPNARNTSAPHGAQEHTLRVIPIMPVHACVPIVTNEPLFVGRTRIRFGDRQKQEFFAEGSRDGFTPFRETDTGSSYVRFSIRS